MPSRSGGGGGTIRRSVIQNPKPRVPGWPPIRLVSNEPLSRLGADRKSRLRIAQSPESGTGPDGLLEVLTQYTNTDSAVGDRTGADGGSGRTQLKFHKHVL